MHDHQTSPLSSPLHRNGEGKLSENNNPPVQPPPAGTVWEVAQVFLRLGFTAFGGPAAHIGLFREEVVTRRGWLTDEHFLDLLGATNLIPGPNSTEMAIHIGYLRAGWRGLIVGGVCFIAPAFFLVLALAALYVQVGTLPAAQWLLYGIKPVIIAVIAQAVWGLRKSAVKNRLLAGLGLAAFGLSLLGLNELLLLFGLGGLYMLYRLVRHPSRPRSFALSAGGRKGVLIGLLAALLGLLLVGAAFDNLFLIFLKIGSVLYGGGYVLLAFLRSEFVTRLGWLTQQQLLDAVAIGQFTPGPLFTSATFVGYILQGVPGALLATIGIFLPAFVFVFVATPFIPRMRRSVGLGALLDGVNVAALGLMAAVAVQLAQAALTDALTVVLAAGAAVLLVRYKINSTWLILGGALIGLLAGH